MPTSSMQSPLCSVFPREKHSPATLHLLFPKNFGCNPHFSGTLFLLPLRLGGYIRGIVRLDLRYSFACSGGRGRRLPVAIVLRLTESADESPPLQIFAYIPFGCRGRRPRRPVRCSANIFNWCKQVKKLLSCVMAWKWQDLYHAIKPFRLFMILWWVY